MKELPTMPVTIVTCIHKDLHLVWLKPNTYLFHTDNLVLVAEHNSKTDQWMQTLIRWVSSAFTSCSNHVKQTE